MFVWRILTRTVDMCDTKLNICVYYPNVSIITVLRNVYILPDLALCIKGR